MGEEWGLSVKLFGKTIMVVPTSKGGDTASGVCAEPGGRSFGGEADELIKDENSIASSSPVTKSTETEEETGGNRDSESPEPEAKTRSEGNEEVEEQVQVQPQREDKQKMDEGESQKKETAVIVDAEAKEEGNGEGMATEEKDGKKKPEKPDKNKILPCPRCKSQDTKFCYYNNYNVNQPRHFCRNCQRYWTAGGSMRNVPVGAGRRKSKSAVAEAANVNNSLYIFMLRQHQQQQQQQQSFMTAEAAALHQRSVSNNRASTVLSFSHNNSVARVAPIGNGSSPAQRDGMVLVYSPAAATSTTTTTTAAATKNHISPSYYNAFTYDQTKREPYYHGDQGKINETNPPVHPINAIKYMPWTLPPTYPAEPVPVWQQPMQLGKHTRDHTDNNLGVDLKQRQYEDDEEHSNTRVWVPKALRITDTPDAAANSSIWTTISASGLGCNKKEHHNLCAKKMGSSSATMERGFFNAFHAKEAPVSTTVTTTNTGANDNRGAILFANPAALARSHQFEETV